MELLYLIWYVFVLVGIIIIFVGLDCGWSEFLNKINTRAKEIQIIIAVIAAVYTGYVYHQQVLDKRIDNSLAFSKKLEQTHIRESFMILSEYWIKGQGFSNIVKYRNVTEYYLKIKEQYKKGLINETQHDQVYNDWENANKDISDQASAYIKKNEYEKHVLTKHAFYHDIVVCVEQNRCDKKTACQLFANDIENFRLNYRTFIENWESAWEGDQSKVLEEFKSDCKKSDFIT